MQYQEFVNRVNEWIQTRETGEAELAIQSTLATLGESISGEEVETLASQLPVELAAQLGSGNYAEDKGEFSLAEFYRRVAEKEGSPDVEESKERARVIMAVLGRATSGGEGGELASIQHRLSTEFEPLFNRTSVESQPSEVQHSVRRG